MKQNDVKTADVAEKRHYTKISYKIVLLVFVIVSLLATASLLLKYRDMSEEYEELKLQVEAAKEEIERMQYQLEQPYDDAYIEKIAREKLGMCYPDEVQVNTDLTD